MDIRAKAWLKHRVKILLNAGYSEQYIDAVLLCDGRFSIQDNREAIEEVKREKGL
jgi:hypothetical protein